MAKPRVFARCAVYTRKSTEEGLEQAFNSLDAQREACEAYVLSQRHEGLTLAKPRQARCAIIGVDRGGRDPREPGGQGHDALELAHVAGRVDHRGYDRQGVDGADREDGGTRRLRSSSMLAKIRLRPARSRTQSPRAGR